MTFEDVRNENICKRSIHTPLVISPLVPVEQQIILCYFQSDFPLESALGGQTKDSGPGAFHSQPAVLV